MFEAAFDEKRSKALSRRRADRWASALHPVDFEIVASAVACEMSGHPEPALGHLERAVFARVGAELVQYEPEVNRFPWLELRVRP